VDNLGCDAGLACHTRSGSLCYVADNISDVDKSNAVASLQIGNKLKAI
jgi:hypothetical protein